jgi:hypothetical protein
MRQVTMEETGMKEGSEAVQVEVEYEEASKSG